MEEAVQLLSIPEPAENRFFGGCLGRMEKEMETTIVGSKG